MIDENGIIISAADPAQVGKTQREVLTWQVNDICRLMDHVRNVYVPLARAAQAASGTAEADRAAALAALAESRTMYHGVDMSLVEMLSYYLSTRTMLQTLVDAGLEPDLSNMPSVFGAVFGSAAPQAIANIMAAVGIIETLRNELSSAALSGLLGAIGACADAVESHAASMARV